MLFRSNVTQLVKVDCCAHKNHIHINTHCEVSGLNATDSTPMYEMPMFYVFGVLGLGRAFVVFVLS